MATNTLHVPVMVDEILSAFNPASGDHFIDATLGAGGHAEAILRRNAPDGTVCGIERDPELLAIAKKRLAHFGRRLVSVADTYDNLEAIVARRKVGPIRGVLFDLGLSSWHLEYSGRGFSFLRDEPLDMRFSLNENIPRAADLINTYSRADLAELFLRYGEESPRSAMRVADAIVRERKHAALERTHQLTALIAKEISGRKNRKIHPATKFFQALRIAVNKELVLLEEGLRAAIKVVARGGKIAAITFQGLEGRIIKKTFRQWEEAGHGMRTPKHALAPHITEKRYNPRSRSAHLYIFQLV